MKFAHQNEIDGSVVHGCSLFPMQCFCPMDFVVKTLAHLTYNERMYMEDKASLRQQLGTLYSGDNKAISGPKTLGHDQSQPSSSVWNPRFQRTSMIWRRCSVDAPASICTDPLQLEPLSLRRRKGNLAEVYKCVNGLSPLTHLFNFADQYLRGHRYKLDKRIPFKIVRTQIRQNFFFCNRVVNDWTIYPTQSSLPDYSILQGQS